MCKPNFGINRIQLQEQNYFPHGKRVFFTPKTTFSIVAGVSALGFSAKKAPKYVTISLSVALVATFIIKKYIVPHLLLPTVYPQRIGDTYENNAWLPLSDGIVLRGYYSLDKIGTLEENKEKKIVVHFHGNGYQADEFHQREIRNAAAFQGHDVLALNYRGTNSSDGLTPPTHRQLVKDGTEIVQSLLRLGFQKKNITLLGHSLGGSIAPCVAKNLASIGSQDQHVRLITSNTFYSLRKILSTNPLIVAITTIVLKMIGLDYMLTAEDWKAIPGDNNLAINGGDGDRLIHENVSLAAMLQKEKGDKSNIIVFIKVPQGEGL